MPTLSVIMPVYNVDSYIATAIDSVLAQTFADFELLIHDDGSTDNTLDLLQQYAQKDARIRLFSSSNQKVAKCLNHLVSQSRGTYIARMDGDDICVPTRFEKQITALKNDRSIGVIGSWVQTFGNKSEIWHYRRDDNFSRALIANGVTALCHPTWMMDKGYLVNHPYDDKYRFIIDRAWLANFALNHPQKKIIAIPEVLLHYRVHTQSVTGQHIEKMLVKTQSLMQAYYSKLNLKLSDMECETLTKVLFTQRVTERSFQEATELYQRVYDTFTLNFNDEFLVFREKWLKFCAINNKSHCKDTAIQTPQFKFLAEKGDTSPSFQVFDR